MARQIEMYYQQPAHGPGLPLSRREHDVLRMLSTGLSNKEIADSLVVSPNTVKTHIRHIYDKLDAHNRIHALARARELGLLQ